MASSKSQMWWMAPLLVGPVVSVQAVCEVYMSGEQAAEGFFPGLKFSKKKLSLSAEDIAAIEKASGETVRNKELEVLRGPHGETVYIDQVLGKHEFITYAVGIDGAGKVKGLEILEYRESYGHEVRRPAWRNQFTGKDVSAAFKVDDDIKSISGATMSSVHITRGVKRVLHSHAFFAKRI